MLPSEPGRRHAAVRLISPGPGRDAGRPEWSPGHGLQQVIGYRSTVSGPQALGTLRDRVTGTVTEPAARARLSPAPAGLKTDWRMEAALLNADNWLDLADNHKMVCIKVVDGVSTLLFFLDKGSPGQVRFDIEGARKVVPIAEFMSQVIPSLSLEIERIEMRKWKSKMEIDFERRESTEELVFQTAPNERQQKDHDDLAKFEALWRKLYEKIFPVWRIVANGTRQTTWTSGQSTDSLVFFCQWLVCIEPTGNKAQFFLDASEQDITQELDMNYLDYATPITDPQITEFYLKGVDLCHHLSDSRLLACFRDRWPSLTQTSSGGDP
jgi:hypothetical protein